MLAVQLDPQLEVRLLATAKNEHQTPAQIINRVLTEYFSSQQPSQQPRVLLVDIAKNWPTIEAFVGKDPVAIQQEMRTFGQFRHSMTIADNFDDELPSGFWSE